MDRVADEKWYKDWYTMGMFALCEDGLYRTPTQKANGIEQIVFPLLYGRKDEGATTLVTETIRSGLPASVKKYYSAKSLRQGGINQATKHKDMNYFFLAALTGHVGDNNSSQYYIDPTDVERTVPALNALHGKVPSARTDMNDDEKLALKDAADQIVTECHRQLNEFMPSNRKTGTTIAGMGKRIGDYKIRIKSAKNLPAIYDKGKVQLIPVTDLEQLEHEKTQRHKGT